MLRSGVAWRWFSVSVVDVGFFFFKQKTAYEMRISDWSSDVCSSDLADARAIGEERPARGGELFARPVRRLRHARRARRGVSRGGGRSREDHQIGRASCRERVCQYV